MPMQGGSTGLKDEGPLPSLDGAVAWLNSPPLTREQLKGKVVLVDFWTYSCINCIRTIPHVRALHERYAKDGLVVIGVHTPEFAFERDLGNVRKAVGDFGIRYPVAIDNDWTIWRAFDNRYWPAHYLADAKGRIRYHHFGEGGETADGSRDPRAARRGGQGTGDGHGARQGAMAPAWLPTSPRSRRAKPISASAAARISSRRAALSAASRRLYGAPTGLTLGQWAYCWQLDGRSSSAAASRPRAAR